MSAELEGCIVRSDATLRDALQSLDKSAMTAVLVVDGDGRLEGLATDGDLRRALLRGASLTDRLSPFVNRGFTAVDPRASRVEVLELMQARRFTMVPVVADGRLVGLHRLHDLISQRPRTNWAVVMAGGRGTRLGALTKDTPKPMLQVAGRPILERIVLHLVGHGISRIFVSVHYLAERIERHFGNGERFGCQIDYLREDAPLGTGGALSLLPEPPTDPLVVMNGDLITNADIGAMIDAHRLVDAVITVGLRRYVHRVPFGCVERTQDGLVSRIEEKPAMEYSVNAGMYVVAPHVVARVPRQEFPMTTLVEQALASSERVLGHDIEGDWLDVGQREQLMEARGER